MIFGAFWFPGGQGRRRRLPSYRTFRNTKPIRRSRARCAFRSGSRRGPRRGPARHRRSPHVRHEGSGCGPGPPPCCPRGRDGDNARTADKQSTGNSADRKVVVKGKRVSLRVALGGICVITKKQTSII